MTKPNGKYDVFVSFNSRDSFSVALLMDRLESRGINCCREAWDAVPGKGAVSQLVEGIEASSVFIAFVGRYATGPWQDREIVTALQKRLKEGGYYIIPVFFPALPREEREKLVDFLKSPTFVTFNNHLDEKNPFERLLGAIKGELKKKEPDREFLERPDDVLRRELENPYKGLSLFLEKDHERFFGRQDATREIIENIEKALSTREKVRLFVLTGASGCGKSSLARAGVMAGLREKWGAEWRYVTVSYPGKDPLYELATQIQGDVGFEAELLKDKRALDRQISQAMPDAEAGKFILLVDQFEEVFTRCQNEKQRGAFIDNLLFAASKDNGKGVVILTLSNEFWQGFVDAINEEACNDKAFLCQKSNIPVVTMSQAELREAIVEPAHLMGVGYDSALLDTLLESAGTMPLKGTREGILPVLQMALQELWQYRNPNYIEYGAYKITNGIHGALEKHANHVYGGLDESAQYIAQHIFLNLVRINQGVPEARQRVAVDKLVVSGAAKEEVAGVVRKLVDERLLVSDGGELEIIHETLIHHWVLLRDWVQRRQENKEREQKKRQQNIEDEADRWDKKIGGLLAGDELAAALAWAEEDTAQGLSVKAKKFLKASQKQQKEEDDRRRAAAAEQQRAVEEKQRADEEQRRADEERQRAVELAHRLVSASLAEQSKRIDLSLLLAMASIQEMERVQSPVLLESEGALLATLQLCPHFDSFLRLHLHIPITRRYGIASYAFNPDESLLALVINGGDIFFWDVKQQTLTKFCGSDNDYVYRLAFNSDGSWLILGGKDVITIWDVKQQRILATLRGYGGFVGLSPDERLLVSRDSGRITLWNVKQQRVLATLHGTEYCGDPSFNSDGSLLAYGAKDGAIILWDVKKRQPLTTLHGHDYVRCLSFSPDGSLLASGDDDTNIILWDVKQQQPLEKVSEHPSIRAAINLALEKLDDHPANKMIRKLTFSSDGSLLAWGVGGMLILWDVKQQQILTTIQSRSSSSYIYDFSPDGSLLASEGEHRVALWDVKQQRPVMCLDEVYSSISCLSFSPGGGLLALANGYDNTESSCILWNVKKQHSVITLRAHDDEVSHLAFSPDGRSLASIGRDNAVILWDVEEQQVLTRFSGRGRGILSLLFSRNGSLLASVNDDETVILWDVKQRRPLTTLCGRDEGALSFLLNPDWSLLALVNADNTITLRDVKQGRSFATLRGHDSRILHLSFSLDESRLASASDDGTIILWDMKQLRSLTTLRGEGVGCLSLNSDGSLLASASDDGAIILWDVEQRQPLATLCGHDERVIHLSFSPDGSLLVSAGDDGTIILWDVKQQRSLSALLGHTGGVRHLSFSPDGSLLASASADKTIILWDVSRTSWRARARRIVNRNMSLTEWHTYMGEERPYRKIFEDLPGPAG